MTIYFTKRNNGASRRTCNVYLRRKYVLSANPTYMKALQPMLTVWNLELAFHSGGPMCHHSAD